VGDIRRGRKFPARLNIADEEADGQYPYRTKGAWAEHWRRFKDRIMKIVNDHQADEDVDELEEEPMDSTYKDESPPVASGSKPKKQRTAVSKKDYEDLAHFIVDNIAEGDVPASKDFDEFAEEVSVQCPASSGANRKAADECSTLIEMELLGIRFGTEIDIARPSYRLLKSTAVPPRQHDHNRGPTLPDRCLMPIPTRKRRQWQNS
jgi:hypothetical protein